MEDREQYLERAQASFRLAGEVSEPELKRRFREAGNRWLALAKRPPGPIGALSQLARLQTAARLHSTGRTSPAAWMPARADSGGASD